MARHAKPGTPRMELLVRDKTLDYPTAAFISKRNAFTQTYAKTEGRIDSLAKPRPYAAGYAADRRSVYWVDRQPPVPQGHTDGGTAYTIFTTTTRLEELAKTRLLHPQYRYPRPIVGSVRKSALEGVISNRMDFLSQPKPVHPEYRMERSMYMGASQSATNAVLSERIEAMSKPKTRENRFGVYHTMWGQHDPVSATAKRASIAPRVEALAEAKDFHPDFKGEKPIQWPVSDDAMKAIASLRIQKLARPRSRMMIEDDYDPFIVTTAALKARATPRMEELCAPIPRKIRQKKVFAA